MKVSIIPWIVKKLKSCLALVEDGTTASQNIAKGKYVIWKGVMCEAASAISSGDTLSSTNLTEVSGGALNALDGKLTFRRKIKTYTNLTLPSGSNPYIKLDDFAGIGISTSKYLVSMLVRGWASITCGTVTLAKGTNGSDIYLMASQQGTIASITVEYCYVDTVINE